MSKIVELPLLVPMYSTYHFQAPSTAAIVSNPTIRNWYLSNVIELSWNRYHSTSASAAKINIEKSGILDNPYFEKHWYSAEFLNGYINVMIRNMLDAGYYVLFGCLDDYYIKGKSWYKERHFSHDGMICGYNRDDKTYCVYAYDSNWIYRKFWTPQKCFDMGRKAMLKQGIYTDITAVKPKSEKVEFSADSAVYSIEKYLDSNLEKYPFDGNEGYIYGITVQDYVAKYVDELYDGTIPYEKRDRRIFRLIWEHKKAVKECIEGIEDIFDIGKEISSKYSLLVSEADKIRMLYASYIIKRRDSLLPVIRDKMLFIKSKEEELLNELIIKTKGSKKNETMGIPEK